MTDDLGRLVRLSMDSHEMCVHDTPQLCSLLVLTEVELRRQRLLADDEIETCQQLMADYVLEGLILKGFVETVGLDESGDFVLGVTEAGEQAYQEMTEREQLDG